jgi:hypothetical protein
MRWLLPVAVALLCGCKVVSYQEGDVRFRSWSLGTRNAVAEIRKEDGVLVVKGYVSENQELSKIVESVARGAVAGAVR